MFVGKRNTTYIEYTENTRFPCIFWERSSFTYTLEKISYFREKEMPFFLKIQERSYSSAIFFGKTTFLEHLKKIYFQAFFWERSSFIFRLKNKIIFSGEKKIIFPDDTRNIFSEHLEKENMVFRAVSTLIFRCNCMSYFLHWLTSLV